MNERPRKILIYCDTPFQLMMAVHLCRTDLRTDLVDLVVADHITHFEGKLKNIAELGLFRRVYYMRAYELDNRAGRFRGTGIKYMLNIFRRRTILRELIGPVGIYDEFFAADILESTNLLYDALSAGNPQLKMVFCEEGPVAVLSDQNHQFTHKQYAGFSFIKRLVFQLAGYRTITGNYSYGYSSVRDMASQKYYFPFRQIPPLNKNDRRYVACLNKIWDYTPDGEFSHKCIFFEESFALGGIECTDLKIVRDLVQALGKDKVLVKLHPRSVKNRFLNMGVRTNADSSVPWELIALNGTQEGSVLAAVSSGSLIHPELYWNIRQNSICLVRCREYGFEELHKKYYETFADVCRTKGLALLPEDREQFLHAILKYALKLRGQ